LNEAREITERIIDDLCRQSAGFGVHRPRYDRGKARPNFLNVANKVAKTQSSSEATAQLSAA
jgi:hypothetical protein